jgi:site-specific recombinase XerD
MVVVLHACVVGPLELHAVGFAGELARQGYTVHTMRQQLGLVAHLSRWMIEQQVDVADLSPLLVEQYFRVRRERGYRNFRSPKALVSLLGYLRGLGVVSETSPQIAQTPSEILLQQFRAYLIGERGLGAASARGYVDLVAGFVERCVCDGEDLGALTAGEVTAFLVDQSRRLSPKTLQRSASALRALLRWWHVQGLTATALVEAVPKVAHRDPGLPRGLRPEQVAAMLGSCDRSCPAGLRDFAMLTLLSRVGLRRGEVAGLRLDDIDWRSGEIAVTGKGHRRDRLPLPCDAGQAIVDYLQHGRPPDALDRQLFVRIRAPHYGVGAGGVTQAVAAAARRAGLGTVYAHRLRHTAATSMLAAGASLTEIGQVLRHRGPLTTSIYAKVDTAGLRALARPWPTGGAS